MFLIIVEKERNLENTFMTLKKGSLSLKEYLRDFKIICNNLATIKNLVSNQDKVFQFAHGLGHDKDMKSFQIFIQFKINLPYMCLTQQGVDLHTTQLCLL